MARKNQNNVNPLKAMENPDIRMAKPRLELNWKRGVFIFLGIALFLLMYFLPPFKDAVDPNGKHFPLTKEGQASLALFCIAIVWWVFEVVPIGVTSVAIGVIQALFLIRKADVAFKDFMDPSVWFIFASIVVGIIFTKTGLTKRMAYKMLYFVGEKTSMILLGVFCMSAFLTLLMAHTAVAATMFPLLMAIYPLYGEDDKQTKFGKALFMGMAYVAGAGSIMTLLGAARGAVAIGFFKEMVGREVSFFELSKYLAPLGLTMVFILWGYMMLVFRPEKKVIPGLRERTKRLYDSLGPITGREILAVVVVMSCITCLGVRSFVPFLAKMDKSAIMLIAMLVFFLAGILTIDDLEDIPWNIILLFGGSMSIGYCLWQTGAASWIAINWLVLFKGASGFVFILAIAGFVLVMTNMIMNVAAIAISMPVALVLAPYMNVAPEVVLFASLTAAGMPFFLLIGAAPNAIAYGSKQFSSGEFLFAGIPASIILMLVLAIFVKFVWPMMGMPVFLPN